MHQKLACSTDTTPVKRISDHPKTQRWIDESMNRWIDEPMNRWIDEPMNRWNDESMNHTPIGFGRAATTCNCADTAKNVFHQLLLATGTTLPITVSRTLVEQWATLLYIRLSSIVEQEAGGVRRRSPCTQCTVLHSPHSTSWWSWRKRHRCASRKRYSSTIDNTNR